MWSKILGVTLAAFVLNATINVQVLIITLFNYAQSIILTAKLRINVQVIIIILFNYAKSIILTAKITINVEVLNVVLLNYARSIILTANHNYYFNYICPN